MVKGDDSLECGGVGKHHLSVYIAHGVDMRNIGLHGLFIDCNSSRSEFDSDIRKVKRIDICLSSDCHQDLVGNDTFFLAFAQICNLIFWSFIGDTSYLGLRIDFDSTLSEALFQPLRKICVETREYVLAVFQYGHLASEAAEDRCEFKSDDSAADYAKSLRNLFNIKDFLGRKDSWEISSRYRQRSRYGTRSNDDMLSCMFHSVTHNGMLVLEGSLSTDQGDVLVTEQTFHTASQLLYDRILSGCHRTEVKPEVKSGYAE